MAREFSSPFYSSAAWRKCRAAFIASKGGLCEQCLSRGIYRAGKVVHHKVHLNADNVNDPSITLGWDNLQLLCQDCHAEVHRTETQDRYIIDAEGNVWARAKE